MRLHQLEFDLNENSAHVPPRTVHVGPSRCMIGTMAPPISMSQSVSQGHGVPSRGDIALFTLRKNFNGMSDVVDEDGLVRMWSNDMGKHIPVRPGGVALVVDVLPTPYDSHIAGHPVSVADVLMHSPVYGPVVVCTFVDRLIPISGAT